MQTTIAQLDAHRYAKCIEVGKRVRWDIDRDVIRFRRLESDHRFLPDAMSRVHELDFLSDSEQVLLSQIQGRTYANILGVAERFISAKMLELSRHHWFGDQTALEALVRFTDEELKHQELFRRIEKLAARGMPEGYEFMLDANTVAWFVLGRSTWAVLAFTLMVALLTQAHYRQCVESDTNVSPLMKDVLFFHWKEESQHAILDEQEWLRENALLAPEDRDQGVRDLCGLIIGIDNLLQRQASADVEYFLSCSDRAFTKPRIMQLDETVVNAYRWQFLVSGADEPRFKHVLGTLLTPEQIEQIDRVVAPLR